MIKNKINPKKSLHWFIYNWYVQSEVQKLLGYNRCHKFLRDIENGHNYIVSDVATQIEVEYDKYSVRYSEEVK